MRKISVLIAHRHLTSLSMEEEFYQALKKIAEEKKISFNELITQIDENRRTENLCSAARIFVLQYLQDKLSAPK